MLFSDATMDIEVDLIHEFSPRVFIEEGESSNARSLELDLHNTNMNSNKNEHDSNNPNTYLEENLIENILQVNDIDNKVVLSLEPTESMSLLHHELIDWNEPTSTSLLSFDNDYSIAYYLNACKPFLSSTSVKRETMTKEDIKFLSLKMKNKKNKRSDGENHLVAVSDPKREKEKDISDGENLLEVPKDGILDILLDHFQERSSVPIEPTQPINLATIEAPQVVHIAQSLTKDEKI